LILRKISKSDATRCQTLRLNALNSFFRWGSIGGGCLQQYFRGLTSKGREGEEGAKGRKGGRGMGGKGEGRGERGVGKGIAGPMSNWFLRAC